MSLKSSILYLIKSQGEVSIDEIKILSAETHHKESCSERRLRELCNSGIIQPIKERTKDGVLFISGYKAI